MKDGYDGTKLISVFIPYTFNSISYRYRRFEYYIVQLLLIRFLSTSIDLIVLFRVVVSKLLVVVPLSYYVRIYSCVGTGLQAEFSERGPRGRSGSRVTWPFETALELTSRRYSPWRLTYVGGCVHFGTTDAKFHDDCAFQRMNFCTRLVIGMDYKD